MNTSISIPSFLTLVFVLALAAGCKIEITVPEGGKVVSASHAYDCNSGKTCVVEVNDFHFAETFDAHAAEDWIFIGWKLGRGYLCQRSESVCRLSNKGLGQYEAISAIVESDETFFLEPEFVKRTPFDEALANVEDENLRACLNGVPPPKRYAEQLTQVDCFQFQYGGGFSSIEGIENFQGLRGLSLIGGPVYFGGTIKDITPLAQLTRLESLSLAYNSIEDVSPLAGLTNLANLNLRSNHNISDLSPLAGLKQLQSLELGGTGVEDISPLAGLKQLQSLELGGTGVEDISPLAGLKQLQSLELGGTGVEDISPLAGLTNLRDLNLRSNHISDLRPLAGLKQLQSLELAGNRSHDISSLAVLKHLRSLTLGANGISDIGPLAGLKQLESLSLYVNYIEDISPLAGLTNLKDLNLRSNHISDLRPLAGLKQLRRLRLEHNFITTIVSLAGLSRVWELNFDSNRITTVIDTLDTMPSLQHLVIARNPIPCAELVALVHPHKYPIGLSASQYDSCSGIP